VTRSLTLSNSGRGTVTIGSIQVQGADSASFTLLGPPPNALIVGATSKLDLSFLPTRQGAFSARLIIQSDAENAPELNVPLVGTSGGSVGDAGSAGPRDLNTFSCGGSFGSEVQTSPHWINQGVLGEPTPTPTGGVRQTSANYTNFGGFTAALQDR